MCRPRATCTRSRVDPSSPTVKRAPGENHAHAPSVAARLQKGTRTREAPMNVQLLRDTFELAVDRAPDLTHTFYEILFERHPEARALFGRNPRAVQEKMLAEALGAVVEHVEDEAWFTRTLGALGARHVAYGIT